jgi:heme exporter protein D
VSVGEFFAMGGYAVYVWPSYGVAAAVALLEIVALRHRRRTLLGRLGRMIRRPAVGMGNETQA